MKEEHLGSDFDDFLREEDLLEDSEATATKRVMALERIQPLLDRPGVHLGGSRPSKDEIHER